jgi:hypothetical protein
MLAYPRHQGAPYLPVLEMWESTDLNRPPVLKSLCQRLQWLNHFPKSEPAHNHRFDFVTHPCSPIPLQRRVAHPSCWNTVSVPHPSLLSSEGWESRTLILPRPTDSLTC